MAFPKNVIMLQNLWSGFFGDKQKDLWERGAELIAPILVKAYLDTPIKRHLDGKVTYPRIELAWVATNNAKIAADNAALLEVVKQLASGAATVDYVKVGEAAAEAVSNLVESIDRTETTINLKAV